MQRYEAQLGAWPRYGWFFTTGNIIDIIRSVVYGLCGGVTAGNAMGLKMEDFGRLLAAKRGSRGVRSVALEAGVSSATFSRVENGHTPDLQTFATLCKWLARDPREFLGMKTEKRAVERPKAVVHFKKKAVKKETATALGELILAAQRGVQAAEDLIGR